MADFTSTINFGGLASGLDTNTIVDQLMAIERRPQTRLKLQQSAIDARKNALSDILTRLKNLQYAAQDLKSPTLWLDTQTVDVNDSTKIAATRTGGAGTGGYQVEVTQLASSSQHWFTYASPASDQTITVGGHAITITAGSDINAAAGAINSDSASPVYASVVTSGGTQYLALSSKTTGAASDFATAGGTVLTEDATKAVAGVNALFKVGSTSYSEATNTITDAIPGVQLTLKGVTPAGSPVSVVVGAPAPDKAAISAKVKAFVEQYNSTVDFIRSKLEEKPVSNPTNSTDAAKGVLYGDTTLTGILAELRISLGDEYDDGGNPDTLDQLAEIGVSTGAAVGSGTLNQDSVRGKLLFDASKLESALTTDPTSVRKLLGGTTGVNGFAQAIEGLLTPLVQAGGTLDETIKIQDDRRRSISEQIADMDDMLAQKQAMLKRQFAAMESALAASQAQGNWLAGQLAALNSTR